MTSGSFEVDTFVCVDTTTCEDCPVKDYDPKTRGAVGKLLLRHEETYSSSEDVPTELVERALWQAGNKNAEPSLVSAVNEAAKRIATRACPKTTN